MMSDFWERLPIGVKQSRHPSPVTYCRVTAANKATVGTSSNDLIVTCGVNAQLVISVLRLTSHWPVKYKSTNNRANSKNFLAIVKP